NGVTVVSAYDLLDRLTNRVVASTSTVPPGPERFVYNSRGLTNYFDQLGHLTVFVRDGLGRVLSQTNANNEALQFTYNPSDELKTLIDGKNQTTTWKYDEYGRVTNKVDALGVNAFIYRYDSNEPDEPDQWAEQSDRLSLRLCRQPHQCALRRVDESGFQ